MASFQGELLHKKGHLEDNSQLIFCIVAWRKFSRWIDGKKKKKNKKRGKMESEDVWKEKNCSGMIYPADFKLKSSRVHKKGA